MKKTQSLRFYATQQKNALRLQPVMMPILLMVFGVLLFISASTAVRAELVLDRLQFDPAIISSGDEVDILVYFHDNFKYEDDMRLNNPSYAFTVLLEPDDSVSEQYLLILDAQGDDLYGGQIMPGTQYYKKFRIKVSPQAPAGTYELKLLGYWTKDGMIQDPVQSVKFTIAVKRESIVLNVAQVQTIPAKVRPGDDFVKITTFIENNGEKPTKSIAVNLELPSGFESSYASNNRVWVGRLNPGEQRAVDFYVDISEDALAKEYQLRYTLEYLDLDNNQYTKDVLLPFLIKPRPYLEIINSTGSAPIGGSGKLYLTIKNTGNERAESVDVRLLKQESQPFTFDVRSDYVGALEPGETGIAVFDIAVTSSAQIKYYDFKVLIRSMGDSESSDDTVYISNRRAQFGVTEPKAVLVYWIIGAILFIGIILLITVLSSRRKRVKR